MWWSMPPRGETLLERDAGAFWYPASLTKLMTLYIVFEELKAGRLTLATPVPLSRARARDAALQARPRRRASRSPSSRRIQSLVARSANDVASALASCVAGSSRPSPCA